jgi:hypothetical protein
MPETTTEEAESQVPAGPISKAKPIPRVEPIAKAESTYKVQTSNSKETGGTAPSKPMKRRRLNVAHLERYIGCLSYMFACRRIRNRQRLPPGLLHKRP